MKHLILATAAAAALLTPAISDAATPTHHRRHHAAQRATMPARAPITDTDAKVIATPAGDTRSTSLATKAPGGPVAATTATTSNMGGGTAVTDVAQTTDHSRAPVAGAKMVRGTKTMQVRCADNSVKTVMSMHGACMKNGGVVSSSVSTVASTSAGSTTALHTRAGGVGATAVTSTDPNSAATTRVTQSTVYPTPVKKR